MATQYHLTIKLEDALAQSRPELRGYIERQTGEQLSRWQLWRRLRQARHRGYHAFPLCADHNALGYCQGHTQEELGDGDL